MPSLARPAVWEFISKTGQRTLPNIDRFIILFYLQESEAIWLYTLRYHGISFDKILPLVIFFTRYYDYYDCPKQSVHQFAASTPKVKCNWGIMVTAIGTSRYVAAESPWSQSNWLQNQRFDPLWHNLLLNQYMNDLMQRLMCGLEWYRALIDDAINQRRRRLYACIRATRIYFE